MEGAKLKSMARITRSMARKKAFEIIFASIACPENLSNELAWFSEENTDYEKQFGYITAVCVGAVNNADVLKETVNKNIAENWSYDRLSKMCKAVLLLAIFEMKNLDDVPPKVAINEAVELAKKYGDDNEPALVNGVLGSVMRNECNE